MTRAAKPKKRIPWCDRAHLPPYQEEHRFEPKSEKCYCDTTTRELKRKAAPAEKPLELSKRDGNRHTANTERRREYALTIKQTISTIRALGLTCSRTPHSEFRVNLKGGTEATAYYTMDADDAIGTAKAMALRQSVCLISKHTTKLGRAVTALRRIAQIGYASQASRCTDTVIACIRVAEEAITEAES